ncbi:MAG: hypothetical protein HY360_11020 [Verrucomicrobia bacterium]|nr:hypothetical protein [Verrucomicrobiota bacterium]
MIETRRPPRDYPAMIELIAIGEAGRRAQQTRRRVSLKNFLRAHQTTWFARRANARPKGRKIPRSFWKPSPKSAAQELLDHYRRL